MTTDQPGVQVYTGQGLAEVTTAGRRRTTRPSPASPSTYVFPDSPHHPDWPSAVLRPGETYPATSPPGASSPPDLRRVGPQARVCLTPRAQVGSDLWPAVRRVDRPQVDTDVGTSEPHHGQVGASAYRSLTETSTEAWCTEPPPRPSPAVLGARPGPGGLREPPRARRTPPAPAPRRSAQHGRGDASHRLRRRAASHRRTRSTRLPWATSASMPSARATGGLDSGPCQVGGRRVGQGESVQRAGGVGPVGRPLSLGSAPARVRRRPGSRERGGETVEVDPEHPARHVEDLRGR